MAVGLLEVYGLATALAAVDSICKAANVRIIAIDKNKPNGAALDVPLLIMIKFAGSVSDVEAGLEAGKKTAETVSGYLVGRVLPSPDEGLDPFLKLNCL